MLNAEQLAAHSSGIGGSSAAAACNIPGAFKSRLELWQELTGRTEREDISDLPHIHFGNVLEPVLRREFMRRTGLKVHQSNRTHRHREHDFMLAHVDGLVVGQSAGCEIKTANAFSADKWGPDGSDEVPMPYLVQCAHYMAVTERDLWYLAVLIGGSDFRIYCIGRDAGLEAMLIKRECEFWQYVLDDVPPPPVTVAEVAALYPTDAGSVLTASHEDLEAYNLLTDLRARKKVLEEQIEAAEFTIKNRMGDASELLGPDGTKLVSWKATTSNRFDTTAFKKAEPALYEKYLKTTSSRRFSL